MRNARLWNRAESWLAASRSPGRSGVRIALSASGSIYSVLLEAGGAYASSFSLGRKIDYRQGASWSWSLSNRPRPPGFPDVPQSMLAY